MKSENYKKYVSVLEEMFEETHLLNIKYTDIDFYEKLKKYNIYEWYMTEKIIQERKDKINKIKERINEG